MTTDQEVEIPEWFEHLTECDPDIGWPYIRKIVQEKIFDDRTYVVPYFDDSPFYSPNAVIVKKSKNIVRDLLFGDEVSKFLPAGHVLPLLTEITSNVYEKLSKDDDEINQRFSDGFVQKFKGKFFGVRKKLELQCDNVRVCRSPVSFVGTVRFSPTELALMLKCLKAPTQIYLISTSYVADYMKLTMKVDEKFKAYEKWRTVVAFELVKYELLVDGTLANPFPYHKPYKQNIKYWMRSGSCDWTEPESEVLRVFDLPKLARETDSDDEESDSFNFNN